MRSSQVLFRRSRSLLQYSAARKPPHYPGSNPARRREFLLRPVPGARLSSSTTPPLINELVDDTSSSAPDPTPEPSDPEGPPSEEPEKPRTRRTRISVSTSKEIEVSQLPEGLDILWTPELDQPESASFDSVALPPGHILDEALHNLHIALHPQTQHKATYAHGSSAVEPTLALYCPIEGGDYIIDATVRELGRRTGAEVIELDAVQLAAGEWGHFGKAGSALQLPQNPLHFPSSPTVYASPSRSHPSDEDEESDTPPQIFSSPQQMTLTLMTTPSSGGRTVISAPSRRSSAPSRVKVFFDALVNMPSKQNADAELPYNSSSVRRPRLIYVRDFQTLSSTSSTWYPPLLSAVRQRRRGPISRPSSPVTNPMVIMFGITPSLTPPPSPFSQPGSNGFLNLLMNRHSPSTPALPHPRPGKSDWSEDAAAEKARERRLRERMRKWEQGDLALQDEIPRLASGAAESDGNQKPDVVIIGGSRNVSNIPFLPPFLRGSSPIGTDGSDNDDGDSAFFRTSILVPNTRSPSDERDCRVARRREINELTMRMGVGAIGGVLERDLPFANSEADASGSSASTSESNHPQIWDDWGQRIETWSNVRQIADRAVGSTIGLSQISDKPTLDPTLVSWDAVQDAWINYYSDRKLRKTWVKELTSVSRLQRDAEDDRDEEGDKTDSGVDEVVERVKADPDLDPHEQRLLPSIVDPASMPTSFSQVHLPAHTIDSVRTIVSLPLLYPSAFQQGILKDHAMTGCLLFGPPGTGKTLVVRALAKEAGCRMMVISPSDVMDMYVGEGEKLVKAVFSLARRLSPCVVFLDEIDALFGARMSARESGGAFAHRGVITEFMQEMDGLKSSKEDNVIIIGATNRPFDLDDAILRRLPRRLLVDLPGEKEREEILKILLRDETLAEDVDPIILAKRTDSFSGSDLKHLCVSAALDAVKEGVDVPWAAKPVSDAPPTQSESISFALSASEESSLPPLTTARQKLDPVSSPDVKNVQNVDGDAPAPTRRVLRLRNFEKALKEITPSSSESLGTLSDLRKWNEEFGEGRKDRKRIHVWGKGRFGFTDRDSIGEEGRVSAPAATAALYTHNLDTQGKEHR